MIVRKILGLAAVTLMTCAGCTTFGPQAGLDSTAEATGQASPASTTDEFWARECTAFGGSYNADARSCESQAP